MERRRRSGSLPNGWGFVENFLVEKIDGVTDPVRDGRRTAKLRVTGGGLYTDPLAERCVRAIDLFHLKKVGICSCMEFWRE